VPDKDLLFSYYMFTTYFSIDRIIKNAPSHKYSMSRVLCVYTYKIFIVINV